MLAPMVAAATASRSSPYARHTTLLSTVRSGSSGLSGSMARLFSEHHGPLLSMLGSGYPFRRRPHSGALYDESLAQQSSMMPPIGLDGVVPLPPVHGGCMRRSPRGSFLERCRESHHGRALISPPLATRVVRRCCAHVRQPDLGRRSGGRRAARSPMIVVPLPNSETSRRRVRRRAQNRNPATGVDTRLSSAMAARTHLVVVRARLSGRSAYQSRSATCALCLAPMPLAPVKSTCPMKCPGNDDPDDHTGRPPRSALAKLRVRSLPTACTCRRALSSSSVCILLYIIRRLRDRSVPSLRRPVCRGVSDVPRVSVHVVPSRPTRTRRFCSLSTAAIDDFIAMSFMPQCGYDRVKLSTLTTVQFRTVLEADVHYYAPLKVDITEAGNGQPRESSESEQVLIYSKLVSALQLAAQCPRSTFIFGVERKHY